MPVAPLPIVGFYNKQRFTQFDPSDAANWYLVYSDTGRKKLAMYPTAGREHIFYAGSNRLIFPAEPRAQFKSVNYSYYVVLNQIFRVDRFYNQIEITQGLLQTISGNVSFDFLVTGSNGDTINNTAPTYCGFTDGRAIYIYNEQTDAFVVVTDSNAPPNPLYIKTFGNRFIVSTANSSQAGLSEINLDGTSFDPSTCWTVAGEAVFLQAPGIIRGFAVNYNVLYIFTDYVTAPWYNIPSTLIGAGGEQTTFPWKNNEATNWPYGLADSETLSVDSGVLFWLGKNSGGLTQPLISVGGQPKPISTEAIDTLIQRILNATIHTSTTASLNAQGFLYSYENSLKARLSFGTYEDTQLVDYVMNAVSLEYDFVTESWTRVIEANGQRCRVQRHIYFGNRHLVSVQGDNTVYEMSGDIYTNDIKNPAQSNPQAANAYLRLPMRYERVTPVIFDETDNGESVNQYVEIDFVFGDTRLVRQNGAYQNTVFIIDEVPGADGQPQFVIAENTAPDGEAPVYIIAEKGNYPQLDEDTYYNYYKPYIELLCSNDAGISYNTADVREFSQIGQYLWRMRWYELGTSRFRAYKLICVSPVPMVILGGLQQKRRTTRVV